VVNSPFNEQKYRNLLEGLEITEILLSDVLSGNITQRIDSEYFMKKYLHINKHIEKCKNAFLNEVSSIKGGKRLPLGEDFSNEGIPYIRSQDIKNTFIDYSNSPKISLELHDLLKRYQTKMNDVLITNVGNSIGDVGIVKFKLNKCNLTENAVRSVCDKIISDYLFIFLMSKYGNLQIKRETVGTAQPKLAIERINHFKIPLPPIDFQKKIEEIVKEAHSKREKSLSLYRQAEELLLETIGLKDFKPNEKGTNIKSFKESFLATGRLDAEYYQPKYEEIIDEVENQPHDVLGNLVAIKKSIEPGSDVYTDEGLPFIRVSDYNKFGISTPEKCLSDGFCKKNAALLQSLYPTKETILFSKDGSVGTAYMVCENMQAVTSGAILHLTVKDKTKVLPEYLTLALNSIVVKMQAERDAGGSIILHWRINEIENVVVPIVDYKIQQQIANLVEESFALRRESERLLEEAKVMVEREVEKGEVNNE
jgi:restriction endonuclease S subunit